MKKLVLPIAIILMLFSVPLNYANGKTKTLSQTVKNKAVVEYEGTYDDHDFVVITNTAHVVTDVYQDGWPVSFGAVGTATFVDGTMVFNEYQMGGSYVTATFYAIN
ncbi:hypothetical protein HK413_10585 [Mucilaginibacter sp. S1162]|uniref:Uncharacterized protein n=1 Tax=Mucilaginibacter humi TaxID=2732510 RepID=A0ABX1W4A6_9SPHI|nr:hypothetical protein [Mucilaginibacter humi]NNU34458.1 hypothetical protein [Mucilaginibacter humi]